MGVIIIVGLWIILYYIAVVTGFAETSMLGCFRSVFTAFTNPPCMALFKAVIPCCFDQTFKMWVGGSKQKLYFTSSTVFAFTIASDNKLATSSSSPLLQASIKADVLRCIQSSGLRFRRSHFNPLRTLFLALVMLRQQRRCPDVGNIIPRMPKPWTVI